MRVLQHVLLSSGHAQPGLHLADLLLPGRQLAPHLLQGLRVLLHLTPNPLLKLLQKLLLNLQLLLQVLGPASQLWDARLKLLSFRRASLCSQQAISSLLAAAVHLSVWMHMIENIPMPGNFVAPGFMWRFTGAYVTQSRGRGLCSLTA